MFGDVRGPEPIAGHGIHGGQGALGCREGLGPLRWSFDPEQPGLEAVVGSVREWGRQSGRKWTPCLNTLTLDI